MDRSKIPLDLIRKKLAAEAEQAKHRLEKAKDILLGPPCAKAARCPMTISPAVVPSAYAGHIRRNVPVRIIWKGA